MELLKSYIYPRPSPCLADVELFFDSNPKKQAQLCSHQQIKYSIEVTKLHCVGKDTPYMKRKLQCHARSVKIIKSLMKRRGNNSADTLIRVYRWTRLSTADEEELSTAVFREQNLSELVFGCRQPQYIFQELGLSEAIDKPNGLSTAFCLWAKSVCVYEFVSDPNSEFWVSFFLLLGLHAYI